MTSKRPTAKTIAIVVAVVLALAWAITQIVGVYTEAVNWDELALFNRAARTLASGHLETGGRPGLGVLLLMPLIKGCTHTMAEIHAVRLVWAAFTFGLLAGVFVFSLRAITNQQWRFQSAALGTALLALVPLVMRWSIQIRTDQPSACFALWGGVLLLASRARPRLAAGAGLLIGLGYLFSQKALYVAGLVGCVALGELFRDNAFALRRDLFRAALVVAGIALSILIYNTVVSLCFEGGSHFAVDSELSTFANYRKLFGYRLYASMLPTLYPHLTVLAATCVCFARSSRRPEAERRDILLALCVATLGVVVGWFHAGAFPYFWTTLGLFPAIACALAWPHIATTVGRFAYPALVALCVWLLWFAVPYRREVLRDTQAFQSETIAFIEDVIPPTARGFNPGGDLFCRADPMPFPTYFREAAEAMGTGPDAPAKQQAFINEFRTRPVSFILETFLLEPFPAMVQEFWRDHYVRYAYAVLVAGRVIEGPPGTRIDVDVIVPGRYTWNGAVPIEISGKRVLPRETIELDATVHPVTLVEHTQPAPLALALSQRPVPDRRPFHPVIPIAELLGNRRW